MSVETKPNKLTKGLVLDTFHTDVDNTVATYALNAQLEDQEGNHFHYGSEVGTTFIKNIPDTHVVIGHINMERNETVLFTTDGTNSTIGILSRNDDMSYNYEIKVDDSKQTKKLGFKKNTYIRGVYRLLNGCDKVIYFVDGINKDRRINLNQLDSYKLPTTTTSEITFDNNVSAIIYNISTLTGDIKLIKILAPTNILTQSNLIANLIRVINFQSNLSTSSSLIGDINFVQKVASSLNAFGTLTGDINFVQNMQASLLTSASVTGNISIPKLVQASLTGTGTTAANLTVTSSASFLLDLYPNAAAAYSLRKLRSAYTGSAIRVRASTSGAEGDVGFDVNSTISASSTVTVTAVGTSGLSIGQQVTFSTFWNAGGSNQNVFVTTWYDQSGNANNATQTTQANQPRIVNLGVIELQSTKPTLRFVNTSSTFLRTSIFNLNTPVRSFVVFKNISSGGFIYDGRSVNRHRIYVENNTTLRIYGSGASSEPSYVESPNILQKDYLSDFLMDGVNTRWQINNITPITSIWSNGTIDGITLGNCGVGSNAFYNGYISEFVIYNSNQNENSVNIKSNINTHYGIY